MFGLELLEFQGFSSSYFVFSALASTFFFKTNHLYICVFSRRLLFHLILDNQGRMNLCNMLASKLLYFSPKNLIKYIYCRHSLHLNKNLIAIKKRFDGKYDLFFQGTDTINGQTNIRKVHVLI